MDRWNSEFIANGEAMRDLKEAEREIPTNRMYRQNEVRPRVNEVSEKTERPRHYIPEQKTSIPGVKVVTGMVSAAVLAGSMAGITGVVSAQNVVEDQNAYETDTPHEQTYDMMQENSQATTAIDNALSGKPLTTEDIDAIRNYDNAEQNQSIGLFGVEQGYTPLSEDPEYQPTKDTAGQRAAQLMEKGANDVLTPEEQQFLADYNNGKYNQNVDPNQFSTANGYAPIDLSEDAQAEEIGVVNVR